MYYTHRGIGIITYEKITPQTTPKKEKMFKKE